MDLEYEVIRSSRRKKVTITVERDRKVVVRAPETTSTEQIARIIEQKKPWLYEKLNHGQKYQVRPHPPGKEVANGECALYLGQEYQIELGETDSGEVEFDRKFLVPPLKGEQRREVLRGWYLERAKETILPRVSRHARELGVEVAEAKIVDNRYRWGSCTPRDHVNLNWRLIKAPMHVIDYVIVHELAHLLEANHTPRFWNIVRAKVANSEKAKEWLKSHGQMLEEEV